MTSRLAPFMLLPVLLAIGCQREPPPVAPLVNEAYVWDTHWKPELAESAMQGASVFSAYRVLAADARGDGTFAWIGVDVAALERSQQPVTAIVRLARGTLPDAKAFVARVLELAQAWRALGVRVAGVELDRGGDASGLPQYADWLREVRARWPAAWPLSVGESPAWTGAPALPALLAQADASVLHWDRVDAVFDPGALQSSIGARATLSQRPFRLALPAYDAEVAPAAATAAAPAGVVDGQSGADSADTAAPALRIAPEQAAALLRTLRKSHPPALVGIAWSRLPLASDSHAWTYATLRGVFGGDSLRAVVKISFDANPSGARELVLANVGAIDAPVPAAVVVAALGCDDGSAQDGYRLERSGDDWRFVATGNTTLPSGGERKVGSLRCTDVLGVKVEDKSR